MKYRQYAGSAYLQYLLLICHLNFPTTAASQSATGWKAKWDKVLGSAKKEATGRLGAARESSATRWFEASRAIGAD